MLHSLNQYQREMDSSWLDSLAKICLTNCGVFGIATWIDPQWITAGIMGVSAIFPAVHYYHKTKKTKLENRILERQLKRMYDEEIDESDYD